MIVPLIPYTLTPGKFVPLGVERAALNILAASCILEHLNQIKEEKQTLIISTWQNLEYIYSMQESDGGFRTIHATKFALAL